MIHPGEIQPTLSAEQLRAVESKSRALVVLAGAGSGKTEVVARRVQRLLENRTPDSGHVLALSYTVKAADGLRARLRDRIGGLIEYVDTETIHGFAHKLIRQHGTKIGLPVEPELLTRDEDRAELMERWRESQGEPPLSDPISLLRAIDHDRATLTESGRVVDWERALTSIQALDYPALLSAARSLLDTRSVQKQLMRLYSHIIVDEAQNLTPAQYDLLVALIGEPEASSPCAMLVGDDKQSIISFAGADPHLVRRFASDYRASTIRLTVNFRSAQQISRLAELVAGDLGTETANAGSLAARGQIRRHDSLDEAEEGAVIADWIRTLLRDGIDPHALADDESPLIRESDIAVLGRSATSLRHTAAALARHEIPYSVASGSDDWLEGSHANIALEFVSLMGSASHQSTRWQLSRLLEQPIESVANPRALIGTLDRSNDPLMRELAPLAQSVDVSDFMARIASIEAPPDAPDDHLIAWSADVEQLLSAWRDFDRSVPRSGLTWSNFRLFCSRRQRGDSGGGVQLLTVHKSQGREFKAVALAGLNDGQMPDFRVHTRDDLLSELRTFYVAITRSRRLLLLTRSSQRQTRYGSRATTPSRYLDYLKRAA